MEVVQLLVCHEIQPLQPRIPNFGSSSLKVLQYYSVCNIQITAYLPENSRLTFLLANNFSDVTSSHLWRTVQRPHISASSSISYKAKCLVDLCSSARDLWFYNSHYKSGINLSVSSLKIFYHPFPASHTSSFSCLVSCLSQFILYFLYSSSLLQWPPCFFQVLLLSMT